MFVIAGEALIDLFVQPDGRYQPVAGGAPYNFARALALQSESVGYANALSNDAFGQILQQNLASSGARHLGNISHKPTSLALVSADENGQPRYSFYRDGVADREIDIATLKNSLHDATIFHSGGLALLPPDNELILQAMQHSRDRGLLCSVDVNMRPAVAHSMGVDMAHYRDAAMAVIERATIVKVSDEDLRHLGLAQPLLGARSLLGDRCRLVVLTLGEQGAWALTESEEIFCAAKQVSVVDTVGAGDCFYAGCIASLQRAGALEGLHHQAPNAALLSAALNHGAISAAINVGRQGCNPPTWDEVIAWRE